ncbi:MAG TPA: hypothetical protein DHW34_06890 [Actinobacteria bacterium]|nr:hypothetical protein [Actinomycetota bacterium]HCK79723.1 hypothetical protein [Actinomycetota bacterium]
MTATESPVISSSRDLWRQIVVLLSAVIAVVVSFLGSGAVVGTPVSEVAGGVLDSDATLVAPGGAAFAIWGVIYTGLLLLGLNQAMSWRRTDARQRRTGWWITASALLNAAWIAAVQLAWLVVSVVLLIALVAVLVIIMIRLNERPATTRYEAVVVDGTVGLYLGWACIATVANSAAAGLDAGIAATGTIALWSAVVVLVVAAVVGVVLAVGLKGRLAPAIGLGWGLAWVAVERASGIPQAPVVAIVAAAAAAVTVLAAVVVRARFGPSAVRENQAVRDF